MTHSIDLIRILRKGIEYCNDKGMHQLLEIVLDELMKSTHCDAGSIYIYKNNALHFKVMKNYSIASCNNENSMVSLPPVEMTEEHVCSFSAIKKQIISIDDVYQDERFCNKGPKRYDKLTGYRTKSMLVVPMINEYGNINGVLQLINAMDGEKNIIPFSSKDIIYFNGLLKGNKIYDTV